MPICRIAYAFKNERFRRRAGGWLCADAPIAHGTDIYIPDSLSALKGLVSSPLRHIVLICIYIDMYIGCFGKSIRGAKYFGCRPLFEIKSAFSRTKTN